MYWRLKKQDNWQVAHNLKVIFPQEFKGISTNAMEDKLRGRGLQFYEEKSVSVPLAIRFTLPLALIAIVLLFIGLPITFMFTGRWGYKWAALTNWLRALGF